MKNNVILTKCFKTGIWKAECNGKEFAANSADEALIGLKGIYPQATIEEFFP